MLVFKQWLTEGIAQLSYLVGDDETHTAAIIDPRPDVEIYMHAAQAHGLAITHILETHIHADFMSGSRELADCVGGPLICASSEGGAKYGFEVSRIRDGDEFPFGSVLLRARHTPGHTPEHMSYEAHLAGQPEHPFAVFSGDSLFVDSVGRPDLLGEDETEGLVEQLYQTMTDYFLKLDDDVLIYPGHGKGSACGPAIGERLSSSIGYERKYNRFLQLEDLAAFKAAMLGDAPPAPKHYPRLKKVNAKGPQVLGAGPIVPPLTPEAFQKRLKQGSVQIVDSRHMLAFGGGHIPGALNLAATKEEMSVFAGWVLDADQPILLVLDDDTHVADVATLLIRVGLTHFAGYLAGGMTAWDNLAGALVALPQMPPRDVSDQQKNLQILDVRQPNEWEAGHIPGAMHHFVGTFIEDLPELDRTRPVVTYCATGYRASLAASLLMRAGFEDVHNMPGSWKGWQASGLPESKEEEK